MFRAKTNSNRALSRIKFNRIIMFIQYSFQFTLSYDRIDEHEMSIRRMIKSIDTVDNNRDKVLAEFKSIEM